MHVEAGLVAFSSACFEFADQVPEEAQHGSLAYLPKKKSSRLHGLLNVAAMGFCALVLPRLLSLLSCAAFISASTPGPAHRACAPRGHLEHDTNSVAVESMTSAMSVAMSLIQVPSGIGGSAPTIAFATWHRRFGSAINRLR